MNKKIYIIWIGWIGTSALARYYLHMWYEVFWSDSTQSELTDTMVSEWIDICISSDASRITADIEQIIHTEAIPKDNLEFIEAQKLKLPTYTYSQALWHIANGHKLIAIAGTHGKSTTTSLTSLVLKNSQEHFTTIVGTLLKEFEWKNFFTNSQKNWGYFIIEACEYKRHFLEYRPTVWVITNIEIDHLDYYKDEYDYLSAFAAFIHNIIPGWYAILNWNDTNCQKLLWNRKDIQYIQVFDTYFLVWEEKIYIPSVNMQVPGKHVLFDASIAYIIGYMAGIDEHNILDALEDYTGVWRRMEMVWNTKNNNMLVSDYGHHPTEIQVTLSALKEKYPQKTLITIFQPHQYSRTLELLEGFKTCFSDTDILIIPNIYASRDSEENMKKIDTQKLVDLIQHPNISNGQWFEHTLGVIKDYDTKSSEYIFLLLWAGDIDNLRNNII